MRNPPAKRAEKAGFGFVLGVLAALPALTYLRGFTVDDALIPARYAANIAQGAGYRFNAQGPTSDGVTPLGFPYLLALCWARWRRSACALAGRCGLLRRGARCGHRANRGSAWRYARSFWSSFRLRSAPGRGAVSRPARDRSSTTAAVLMVHSSARRSLAQRSASRVAST
jgi:hypothetical protein